MAKISVIVKTKNSENTLCETLESVKCFDEIIVIDEHSTDDTVEIAKEYKTKIIYSLNPDFDLAFNQAKNEAIGEWIFVVFDDEIIPKNLSNELKNRVQKPKNKNSFFINRKTFYLNKEVKSERGFVLRLFKKNDCKFKKDLSLDIRNKKSSKINKNFCILKYQSDDIIKNQLNSLFQLKNEAKSRSLKFSFAKPVFVFIKEYFFKKACLDGARGFVFAFLKTYREFILQTSAFEKFEKEEKKENDC